MKKEALELAQQGYKIFPARNKKPLVRWKDHATNDPGQIDAWWTQWPDAQIALPTGKINKLFVIDIDPNNGGDWIKLAIKYPCIGDTDTRSIKTPSGGFHLYYEYTGSDLRNTASKLMRGVDTRGEGGYVIAAPSKGYEVEWNGQPEEIPDDLLSILKSDDTQHTPEEDNREWGEQGGRNHDLFKMGQLTCFGKKRKHHRYPNKH